jgi:hypothetical protein
MFDFLNLKKTLGNIVNELAGIRSQIEKLQRQREDIINAPATRDDVKAMIEKWTSGKSAQYILRLQFNLQMLITNPTKLTDETCIEQRMTLFGKSRQTGEHSMFPGPELEDMAICCLMGPTLVQSLHTAIDAMDNWPVGAIPLEGRDKKIRELDEKISKLVKQDVALTDSAQEAGVHLDWSTLQHLPKG